MAQNMLSLGHFLRLKRLQLNISQRHVCRRAGLTESYVTKVESDSITPSLHGFCRLAMALELTQQELMVIVSTLACRDHEAP